MLRLLKMLVLPLVSVSMVAGVVSLRQADGGEGGQDSVRRMARLTAAFYIGEQRAAGSGEWAVGSGRVLEW